MWGDFIPFGCDGSRLECPRTTELERRLGRRQDRFRPHGLGNRDRAFAERRAVGLAFRQRRQGEQSETIW